MGEKREREGKEKDGVKGRERAEINAEVSSP